MKKRTEIIILISIFSVVSILLVGIYILNQYETYTVTIESIDDLFIYAYFPIDKTYTKEQDTPIYDNDGNLLNISDIKVGDTVFVFTDEENGIQNATIRQIDNDTNSFTVKAFYENIYYLIFITEAENALIIDSSGNKVSVSDLNIGDTIDVVNKKAYWGDKRPELKIIMVLSDNTK